MLPSSTCVCPIARARLAERRQEIQIDDVRARLPHALDDALGVAADVQPHRHAQRLDGRDQPLLVGQHELA